VDSYAVHVARDTGAFDQSILKRSTLCKSQCAGGGLWDVLRTSRSVRSGHRRPQPCRSKSAARRAALRAGGRLCTWTHPASTLRPLSPYGPDKRGLPSYPRFPALRCCGSSVRRGIRCCGIGGQGARQPSLRSGRLWRPARAEQDNSRRHTPCPQCLLLVRRGGKKPASRSCVISPIAVSRCFGGHGRWCRPCDRHQLSLSTSQKNTAPP